MSLPPLQLKRNEGRRLRAGHLWVFSNEIDTTRTPLSAFEPGQDVELIDDSGKFLGHAYVNPNSLICARIVSRERDYPASASLITHRLNIALSLRERLFAHPYYRLVYGEGDGLPGLVVDRFGDVLSVQITTFGMEKRRDEIIACLDKLLRPKAIILRNDSSIREMEGLPRYVEVAHGTAPELLDVIENDCRFQAPAQTGQKTGWFYDHRLNRGRLTHYVKDLRVLDVFSYMGGWGIPAAVAGAREVLCIDESNLAIDQIHNNAALNNVGDRVATLHGDAFDALKQLRAEREHFDVIVLDPPAFIKRKKDIAKGTEAYRRLNQMAMQVLSKDGILVSASCSYHMDRDELRQQVLQAARHIDRNVVILEQGHQGPDHPVHPAIPETDYLKAFICRVTPI
ncbi:MAG: class I SAM-dependent rRNA methyltransferase [Gammaproteobacteria bacterium]|nr:class I SAM-dependent rRNA methyltransferase [Gammaproteobacteria bacterium]